jgi:hypothetical protein
MPSKLKYKFYFEQHHAIKEAYISKYQDDLIGEVSILTAPPNLGIHGWLLPGDEVTYEVWFPGAAEPLSHFTMPEIEGVIKYLRQIKMQQEETES